jgi:hypothetical protein
VRTDRRSRAHAAYAAHAFAAAVLAFVFEPVTVAPDIAKAAEMEQAKSIGSAKMLDDGTIVLDLRATGGGALGDARLTYAPGDPNYQGILRHLGGLRPGEQKQVPPWENAR